MVPADEFQIPNRRQYLLVSGNTIDKVFNLTMTNFIETYKEEWKIEFESLKKCLCRILDGFQIDIQHVGSTAIPELFAKPILDIDIIIENKTHLDDISAKLEEVGYKSRGEQGVSGRFAFRQTSELTPEFNNSKKWQEHHLYVCFSDSLALKNHLLFRKALLKDKRPILFSLF